MACTGKGISVIYYSCFLLLPVFMDGSTYVCQEPTFPKILSKI